MLQWIPLKDTVAGREVWEMGWQEGWQEGLREGRLIAQIEILAEMLGLPPSPMERFEPMTGPELEIMLRDLKARCLR